MRKQLATTASAPRSAASTRSPEEQEEATDAAFAIQVARLAEVFGPAYVCQDQSKFIEDLLYFMHYAPHPGNEGLRQYHESSLDGTDGSGVFRIEDAYEIAFKHMYQTRAIQFTDDVPPSLPMAMQPEDYEEDRDPSSKDLSKQAPLISHTESLQGMVQTWASDVLMTQPQIAAAAGKLPTYPTFLDALAIMRDVESHIADVPTPSELATAAAAAPAAIADESLVCIAKKAAAMCLDRATYDSLRQCAEEYTSRMCQCLPAMQGTNAKPIVCAQAVQEAVVASDHLTVLGYGYKG
jgi:hypothetical protein